MKTLLNTARTIVVGLTTMVWYASRIIVASFTRSPRLREIASMEPRKWAHHILRAARVEVKLVDGHRLASGGPAVLVANHESWFDVFALVAHLPVDYRFVGKVELTRIPFFGRAWLAAGHIPVDRGDRQRAIASLDHAGEILHRDKAVVVMFPEGTRSPDGDLLPFKKGAFVLAVQAGVPVIPLGVRGSRDVMPKGSFRIRPGTVELHVGEPISTEGMTVQDRDDLLVEARARVELLRGRLPGPLATDGPSTETDVSETSNHD